MLNETWSGGVLWGSGYLSTSRWCCAWAEPRSSCCGICQKSPSRMG
ncbi:unnamed protein product [Pylaiella littoralis]